MTKAEYPGIDTPEGTGEVWADFMTSGCPEMGLSKRRIAFGPLSGRARAFSMVEILVVLIILSIMTTVALFSYSTFKDSQSLQMSADKARRILMQGRNRAINLNLPQEVVVDLDRESMWVNQLNSTRTQTSPKVVPEERMADFVRIEELRINSTTFTSGEHVIAFEPAGGNPLVVLSLKREADDPARDENYFSVRLFPTSGEAQILENQRL